MKKSAIIWSFIQVSLGLALHLVPTGPVLANPKISDAHYRDFELLSGREAAGQLMVDLLHYPADDLSPVVVKSLQLPTPYLKWSVGLNLLPPPAANSSARTQAELKYLLELQRKRNKNIEDFVLKQDMMLKDLPKTPIIIQDPAALEVAALFFLLQGTRPDANPEKMPATAKLLKKSVDNIKHFCFRYKNIYQRPRPAQLNPSITSLLPGGIVPPHSAYPSGHSCMGYGIAFVMQDVAPKFQKKFRENALALAVSREWAGIHYPSDNEASRVLARGMVDLFLGTAEFSQDVLPARKEWGEL